MKISAENKAGAVVSKAAKAVSKKEMICGESAYAKWRINEENVTAGEEMKAAVTLEEMKKAEERKAVSKLISISKK